MEMCIIPQKKRRRRSRRLLFFCAWGVLGRFPGLGHLLDDVQQDSFHGGEILVGELGKGLNKSVADVWAYLGLGKNLRQHLLLCLLPEGLAFSRPEPDLVNAEDLADVGNGTLTRLCCTGAHLGDESLGDFEEPGKLGLCLAGAFDHV